MSKSSSGSARRSEPTRQRPYLEPLEPRILLSADVGLVPDALLAPPADSFDPRLILEPAVHDEVLVREPSRFEAVVRSAFVEGKQRQAETDAAGLGVPNEAVVESVESAAVVPDGAKPSDDAAGAETSSSPEDPDAAARALASRVWQADLDRQLSQSTQPEQVVVVDARIPEIDSLLEALLEGVGGSADGATPALSPSAASDATAIGTAKGEILETQRATDGLGAAILDDHSTLDDTSITYATRAERLADALEARGVTVVVLDAERDGLEQLSEIARAYQGVGALHVVSHGARGSLTLGKSRVTTETLRARAGLLAGLRDSLGEDGDLLLYGCEVAEGEVGIEFVSTLAELGGVDVAASTDLTGAALRGGDWDLEFATGEIEAVAIRAAAFDGVLRDFTLPASATELTNDLTLSYDATDMTWRLTVSGGAALQDDATPPVEGASFDLAADEDVNIALGTGVDRVNLVLDGAGATIEFTGNIRIDGGEGEDELTVSGSGTGFAGELALLGGAGADTLEVAAGFQDGGLTSVSLSGEGGEDTIRIGAGYDPTPGVTSLAGGGEGDFYDLSNVDNAQLRDLEIVEDASGEGTDRILYPAPVASGEGPAFVDSASMPVAQSDVIEETDVVDEGSFTQAQVQSIIDGLSSLRDEVGALGSSGEFALGLAGVLGNADVSVGGALDLAEAFDQLALEIEANREGLTVEALQVLLENFSRSEAEGNAVENLDRTLFGEVIPSQQLDHSSLGFTLRLDEGEVFRFGLAAQSGVTVVRVEMQPGAAGLPGLTFRREQNGDATIRRSAGGWRADGFRVGQTVALDAALTFDPNDSAAQRFEIVSVSGDDRVITVSSADDAIGDFDLFLENDVDPDNDLLTSRTLTTVAAGSQVAVANTLFVAEGIPSFAESGFRAGQAIRLSVTPGATPATDLMIETLSEDGRVLTVAEDGMLPTLVAGQTASLSARPFSSSQSLSELASEINARIAESDLSGSVQALVSEVGTAGTQTARLGFRVLDPAVRELALVVTDDAPVGFVSGEEGTLSGLADELSGLGRLEVRVAGPTYRPSTFDLEQTGTATLTRVAGDGPETVVFDASTNTALTFNVTRDGQGRSRGVTARAGMPCSWTMSSRSRARRETTGPTRSSA